MDKQTKKRGRPCGVTPEKLDKLEKGFMLGLNDTECCLYADISTSAFYRYLEKNPKFREKKEVLKKKPLLKAKMNINDLLDSGDEITSRWYLEKRSDEFSAKHDVSLDTSGSLSLESRSDALKGFLSHFLDD